MRVMVAILTLLYWGLVITCALAAEPGAGRPSTPPIPPDVSSLDEAGGPDSETDATIAAIIVSFKRAVAAKPGDAEAHYRLALALRGAKRRPESVEHFEKAVQIGPATPGRLLDLGVAYSDVSRFTEAEAVYERLLALSPGNPDALLNLANIALRRGSFDSAIELYRRAIASKPDHLFAWYHLGHTLKFLGRQPEAYEAYGKVLDLKVSSERAQLARIDAFYQIGSIDLARGDYERAEKRFMEVIRTAPDHRGAHWGRAQALMRLGRQEEARREIEAHKRILEARPPSGPSAMSQ